MPHGCFMSVGWVRSGEGRPGPGPAHCSGGGTATLLGGYIYMEGAAFGMRLTNARPPAGGQPRGERVGAGAGTGGGSRNGGREGGGGGGESCIPPRAGRRGRRAYPRGRRGVEKLNQTPALGGGGKGGRILQQHEDHPPHGDQRHAQPPAHRPINREVRYEEEKKNSFEILTFKHSNISLSRHFIGGLRFWETTPHSS